MVGGRVGDRARVRVRVNPARRSRSRVRRSERHPCGIIHGHTRVGWVKAQGGGQGSVGVREWTLGDSG